MSEDDRKKINLILGALQRHFEPTRNVVYERFKFNTCEQSQGETVAQYITKLRQLASTCEFGGLESELIRDRLVLGTIDASARARMLRELKLDLNKAIEMCRNSEITKSQLQNLSNEREVNYTRKSKKNKLNSKHAKPE